MDFYNVPVVSEEKKAALRSFRRFMAFKGIDSAIDVVRPYKSGWRATLVNGDGDVVTYLVMNDEGDIDVRDR